MKPSKVSFKRRDCTPLYSALLMNGINKNSTSIELYDRTKCSSLSSTFYYWVVYSYLWDLSIYSWECFIHLGRLPIFTVLVNWLERLNTSFMAAKYAFTTSVSVIVSTCHTWWVMLCNFLQSAKIATINRKSLC